MINNRYTILEKIGEGRSKVFSCTDKFFPDEKVAIKILQYTASDSEIEYFNSEFDILKRLSHPNIISVYDRGTILSLDEKSKSKFSISENDKFYTMERMDGVNFYLCTSDFSEAELTNIIHQISLVLFYIHQANYIFFDLKPENILVSKLGKGYKIKLIDFGLAKFYPELKSNFLKGTSEYLAPEILKKEDVSFNVDLYSFGIVLYHLAYHKYPFKNGSELEIFRAHIGKQFEFPSSKYSSKIILIIKKLLVKNKFKRYSSSLEIIDALNQKITFDEKINLTNSLKYVERIDADKQLDTYIHGDIWGKIAVLRGKKGSGKSLFLENLFIKNRNSVLIRTSNFISSTNFWQQFFSRLLYSEAIYRSIDDSLIQYVSLHIDDNSVDLLVELKTIISKIASTTEFTLVIDDFDGLDSKIVETFIELFPILLANQIKIIISTQLISKIEFPDRIEKVEVELKPFSDKEVKEVINNSYGNFIDRKELENLVLSFSERTPSEITHFISSLITSGIIDFNDGKISVKYNEAKITKLLSSQNEAFMLTKNNLSKAELEILETIALFINDISVELIANILGKKQKIIFDTILVLREKNIIKPTTHNRNPSFINEGFKQFIYKNIISVPEKHLNAGNIIVKNYPKMDDLIKIRQFELANNFEKAEKIIADTLQRKNISNFPQIKVKLLKTKLSYKLKEEEQIETSLHLCEIYSDLGKYNDGLNIIKELESKNLSKYYKLQIKKTLGILLIKTGKIKNGIKLLIEIMDSLPKERELIYLELASAYIEQSDYLKADSLCREILKRANSISETTGRAQNLLGISNLYNKSDLNITLNFFKDAHKTYTKENNFNRIAGSEVNLGNIQNILGNFSKAEKHWNKALQLNRSIGNVEQEANVLLNSGIFNYEHSNYEKAIDIYKRAGEIFKGLGNKYSFGLVNTNLSETYLEMCEYQSAYDSLKTAKKIFAELNNNEELLEVHLMECKLFVLVQNKESLQQSINQIKKLQPINSERGKLLFDFYSKYLAKLNLEPFDLEKVNIIKKKLALNNDRLIATEIQFLLAEEYFKKDEYGIVVSLLHSKSLTDICEFNEKYEANRLFILSKIPTKYQSDLTLTKNFLLQKSYAILQNNSISELTLFVLCDLSEFYYERGNSTKAKEYAKIAQAILDYIQAKTNSTIILETLIKNRFKDIIFSINKVFN